VKQSKLTRLSKSVAEGVEMEECFLIPAADEDASWREVGDGTKISNFSPRSIPVRRVLEPGGSLSIPPNASVWREGGILPDPGRGGGCFAERSWRTWSTLQLLSAEHPNQRPGLGSIAPSHLPAHRFWKSGSISLETLIWEGVYSYPDVCNLIPMYAILERERQPPSTYRTSHKGATHCQDSDSGVSDLGVEQGHTRWADCVWCGNTNRPRTMWTRNNPTAVSSKEKAHMQILKFCPLHPNEKQEPELRMEKHELTLRIENTLGQTTRRQVRGGTSQQGTDGIRGSSTDTEVPRHKGRTWITSTERRTAPQVNSRV